MHALVLVGAGGFSGAVLRWVLDVLLGTPALSGGPFVPALPGAPLVSTLPLGTLTANVLAAFLLGVVLSGARLARRIGAETRLLVGTGFCGSLSTYSTFAAETATAAPAVAGAYVVATYTLGFVAVVAGDLAPRWWT